MHPYVSNVHGFYSITLLLIDCFMLLRNFRVPYFEKNKTESFKITYLYVCEGIELNFKPYNLSQLMIFYNSGWILYFRKKHHDNKICRYKYF